MVYRFCAAMCLVVAISLAGTSLEKRTLALRREVTRQTYRRDVLSRELARCRMLVQSGGAPSRRFEMAETMREDRERTVERKPIKTKANR
jgi:hypothetical protein